MVRTYRRPAPYRAGGYGRTRYTRARRSGGAMRSRFRGKRGGMYRGNKFRSRLRTKGGKWQKFVIYTNINPCLVTDTDRLSGIVQGFPNILAPPASAAAFNAGAVVTPNQRERIAWFGTNYAGLARDGFGNPNAQMGNGMLATLAARDNMFVLGRWDYGATQLKEEDLINQWNRLNNAAGQAVQIPITKIFVKGVKVNLMGRNNSLPGLMYSLQTKADGSAKFYEQIGKLRWYGAAKKNLLKPPVNIGGVNYPIKWDLPQITFAGPVYTRIRYTFFYKVKSIITTT